jgi:hypothetical protein
MNSDFDFDSYWSNRLNEYLDKPDWKCWNCDWSGDEPMVEIRNDEELLICPGCGVELE